MPTYPELHPLNLAQTAQSISAFWKKTILSGNPFSKGRGNHALRSMKAPSANGAPGIHHVLSRTVKDIFCRYKTQQGFQVQRKSDWDTHGLSVELAVEKQLGITKKDIGTKISIAAYNAQCRQAVLQYKEQWDALVVRG